MADPLFPNPSEVEGPAAWIVGQQRQAQSAALQGLDANPDDGARAIELGKATGADPAVVYGDLDRFQQQHKAALTSQLLSSNQFLRDYANSHAMAPVVSADDWGQLDEVSRRLHFLGPTVTKALSAPGDMVGSAVKSFYDSFTGEGKLGQWAIRPEDQQFAQDHPFLYGNLLHGAQLLGAPLEVLNRTVAGTVAGGGAAVETGALAAGASPETAVKAKEAAIGTVDTLMQMTMSGEIPHVEPGEGAVAKAKQDSQQREAAALYAKVRPFIEKGEKPPVGLDPAIDKLYAEQAKTDVKNLDDTMKEAQKSSTRERAPNLFEGFIKQHTDQEIGINAEAVRKLYGDKLPEAGDGILGDVPGMAEQLQLAETHGGDVQVPLATWLAKVDPEVAKELRESIRVRSDGMTLEETKAAKVGAAPEPKPAEGEVAPPPPSLVDSLREASGLAPKVEAAPPIGTRALLPDDAKQGPPVVYADQTVQPTYSFPASDILKKVDINRLEGLPKALYMFFQDHLDKLAGDIDVHVGPVDMMHDLFGGSSDAHGLHTHWDTGRQEIWLSEELLGGKFGEDQAAHTVLHEVAHGATVMAIEREPAIKKSIRAMMNEFDAYLTETDPAAREAHDYAFTNEKEFIAEGFSKPALYGDLVAAPLSDDLARAIGLGKGPHTIWDAVRKIVGDLLEKLIGVRPGNSMLDGLLHIGKVIEKVEAERKGEQAGAGGIEPGPPIDSRTLGMNKERAARMQELIKKQAEEDAGLREKGLQREAAERQSQEWKDNYPRVREEVKADLAQRPDIAADRLLRTGKVDGKKLTGAFLQRNTLTEEQIKGLPKEFIATEGVHPDDLAGAFGYHSGDALVAALSRLEAERQLEGLTPAGHLRQLVDAEAERAMRREFGDPNANEFDEAKDHVLSPTQMEMLSEQMFHYAEQAGAKIENEKVTLAQIKGWVRDQFDKLPVAAHSSKKYMAAMRRAAKRESEALLDGDAMGAYKAKQDQLVSAELAKLATKLEKEQASFEKLAKRYAKREIPSVPAEFTNWIHDILMRTGTTVRRSVQDLQDAIGRESHDNLRSFVEEHNNDTRIWEMDNDTPSDFSVMPVAEFLYDPAYRKPVEEMTPAEFRGVSNSIKTLAKNGQEKNKLDVRGDKRDLKEVVGEMVGQLKDLFQGKEKQYAFGQKETFGSIVRTAWASLLQIESIFNRFDRGDPKGIFHRAITQPIFEGSHHLNTLETEHARLYRALDFTKAEMKKRVENPLFGDPLRDGEKIPMTRGNLLAALQNVGNASNLDKLARGYGIENPAQIMQWLFANTKKEDWDRAQELGDIFAHAFDKSANMYHAISGVAPERIELQPIQTPFGEYKGWYHPLIYDPLRPGTSKKLMGKDPLEDGAYYRAATPAGYTRRRTGYAAPIQLNFEAIPNRLKAMLNDIAMRPAVTEVAKVFYDRDFQTAITKGYGKEIRDLLLPYLKDIAGQKQYKDAAQSTAMRVLELFRQNVTATLIGLNPSTVLKHGPTAAMLSIKEVGAAKFFKEMTTLLSMNDELGERNWTFAMKGGMVDGSMWNGSEELQRRYRNWQETVSGAQADVFGENTLRNVVIKLGATPVAISDLLSAVTTWLVAYKDQIRAGESHGDAVQFGNTAVRRAHGSSAVAARPRIMRGGPLAQLATPFYTFFNEMFQRQYEMAWRAKDALGQFSEGEYKAGLKEVPNLVKGLWAYVVFPALVEQMVSPLVTGQESTTEQVLTYGARTLASGIPVLRDLVEAFLGNRDPTIGLYSTGAKMLTDAVRDVPRGKAAFDRKHAANTIKHTVTAFGAATGLTNAQEGRTAEFVYKYATGQERPKDTGELLRGLWHGTIKEPKR